MRPSGGTADVRLDASRAALPLDDNDVAYARVDLVRHLALNATLEQIAAALGGTPAAVAAALKRQGLVTA